MCSHFFALFSCWFCGISGFDAWFESSLLVDVSSMFCSGVDMFYGSGVVCSKLNLLLVISGGDLKDSSDIFWLRISSFVFLV